MLPILCAMSVKLWVSEKSDVFILLMMFTRAFRLLLRITSVGCLLFSAGCVGSVNENRRLVMVGTAPEKVLIESFLPEDFRVEPFVTPGINPMTVEMTDSLMRKLEGAEAYLCFLSYPFEDCLRNEMGSQYPEVSLIYVTRSLRRDMSGFWVSKWMVNDPQLLHSVRTSQLIVMESAARLAERFPDKEEEIINNSRRFNARLQQIDDSLTKILRPFKGESFVTVHPMLRLFAKDYGLQRIYLKPEGKTESEEDLAQRINEARESRARVIFYDRDSDRRLADSLAALWNVKSIKLQLDSLDYIRNIVKVGESITGS